MRPLAGDFRIAVRSLARARGFTFAVIGTLGLGIALEASAIVVVNAYLVRDLPYPASERLYQVSWAPAGEGVPEGLAALDWGVASDVVEHAVAWDLDVFYLVGGDYPEPARGAWVTPGFMDALGVQPALGRSFQAQEFAPGGPQVALISDALWRRRFGANASVTGRRFDAYVSDRPDDPEIFTIVGVLPPDFWHFNPYTDVLTPLRAPSYPYMVRLREGVPPALAEERLTRLLHDNGVRLAPDRRVELRSVHAEYVSRTRPLLVAVTASVSLVLLIACANVAFLVLLRAMRREKDVALRMALGAGRWQVARLLAAECLLLTAGAAVLGTALAWLLVRWLAPVIAQQLGRSAPGGIAAVGIDGNVAVAVAALAVLIALALTLTPLLVTARRTLFGVLRRGRGGGDAPRAARTRFALIAVEVAGSLALLSGCGLMVRTVMRLVDVDLGLEPAGVQSASLAVRDRTYPDDASRTALYERLLVSLEAMPGVRAAALSFPPPLAELDPRPIRAEGAASPPSTSGIVSVTPGYFSVLAIALLQGRLLTMQDRGASQPVAVISRALARRLWPDGSAIGRRIEILDDLPGTTASPARRTIVGVVGDVRHSPADAHTADVYVPLLQMPGRFSRILLRTEGPAVDRLAELRRIVRDFDPEITVNDVRSMPSDLDALLARPRFLAGLFTAFGSFATLLAVLGVYAAVATAVRQREHEVAVRMAVGADARAISRLFLGEGAVVVLGGIGAGTLAALGLGRLLEAQLFGVRPLDAVTVGTAAIGLAAACLAAIWWPVHRATATDPVIALREE